MSVLEIILKLDRPVDEGELIVGCHSTHRSQRARWGLGVLMHMAARGPMQSKTATVSGPLKILWLVQESSHSEGKHTQNLYTNIIITNVYIPALVND